MVRISRAAAVLVLGSAISLSGCGLKHLLGEAPPPIKVVAKKDADSANDQCPPWNRIYEGSEAESATTFECWVRKEPDLWNRIRGTRPDELTDREIGIIIKEGVISVGDGDRELIARRTVALKNLLGFGPTLTRAKMAEWIAWIREHRSDLRGLYQRDFPIGKTSSFSYSDAVLLSKTAASFLRKMSWTKSSAELGQIVGDAFGINQDAEMTAGLEPGMRVLRNLIGFACPLASDDSHINTNEIANCLESAARHFAPSARWLEFMINDKSAIQEPQVPDIQRSVDATAPLVQAWFSQPELNPINTQLWFDWAKKMGGKPPENFIESLGFLRRLKDKSNEKSLHPTEMNRIFSIVREYEKLVLEAIPHYSRAFLGHQCVNKDVATWKDCVLDPSTRARSSTLDMILRIKNPRNGHDAVPLNGSTMGIVTLYHAIAKQLIEIFDDDKDGFVSADVRNQKDEVVQLIATGVATYQAIDRYLFNVSKRIDGQVAQAPDSGIDLSRWDLAGFAKLVALTHDVLVDRDKTQRNAIRKILANLTNNFPKSALFMDQLSITSVLTTITFLPDYRRIALQEILRDPKLVEQAMHESMPISRETFRAGLGDMLKRNFPRTYQSCEDFGFDVSCFIAFDEVMPSADDNRYVMTSDLDVLTIMAVGMEGVFDACGESPNGKLHQVFYDGNDELDCAYTRMKDVTDRLIESRIIDIGPRKGKLIELALSAINATFLTREIGKVALIRGTSRLPILNIPLFWAYGNTATIGSSYALLSDIVASDRVRDAKDSAK